jgi:hypothetical protein
MSMFRPGLSLLYLPPGVMAENLDWAGSSHKINLMFHTTVRSTLCGTETLLKALTYLFSDYLCFRLLDHHNLCKWTAHVTGQSRNPAAFSLLFTTTRSEARSSPLFP